MICETDVLIVGAGPTGLALALGLQQAGIRYRLIERLGEGQNTSRAAVIHAHTLEELDRLGISDALVEQGLPLTRFAMRDRDRPLVELDFGRLPSRYPLILMIPQDATERILAERLVELGGSIERGVSAIAAGQEADHAWVLAQGPDGEERIRARYIVAADGMHSAIRTAAGIGFQGGTYDEQFVLADVRMESALGSGEVSLFLSPDGLVVVAPLPNGNFRIVATVEGEKAPPDLALVQQLLDSRGPESVPSRVSEIAWSSTFRVHHRVADSYRSGRFLLMGDAAHVHSPAGGQGMNTGLVDAVVLAQILASIFNGEATEDALDGYSAMRRTAAAGVLTLAGRLTDLATLRGRARLVFRNLLLRLASRLPGVRNMLLMNLSGLNRRAYARPSTWQAAA